MARTTIELDPGGVTPTFGFLESAEIVDRLIGMVNGHATSLDVLDGSTAVPGDNPGIDDDRAYLQAIIDAALVSGAPEVVLRPGVYRVSKYLDIFGAYGLHIVGKGVRIKYPSASGTTDAIAETPSKARSAFLVRYCTNVTIEGITFEGSENGEIINTNLGHGVYATHTVGLELVNCHQRYGASLIQHDALTATTRLTTSGTSLAVASGVVTLVDSTGGFKSGHGVGARFVTISGATNPGNNGTFPILSAPNSTTITFSNANGVAEGFGFRWTIDDNDRGLRIRGGSSTNARLTIAPTHDSVIDSHRFDHPDTPDLTGEGGAFSISGSTVTFSSQSRDISPRIVGRYVTFSGSTSAANNGRYLITAATSKSGNTAATLTYTNAAGVTEIMPRSPVTGIGRWWIANGEKTGLGAGATALARTGNTMTLTSATAVFAATDVGRSLRVMGATSAANNNSFAITTYVSPTQVQYTNTGGVAETYSGLFTIDGFDRAGDYGASHAIYIFAGRSNVRITNCTFRNIRINGVKVSGSSLPITDISVDGCYFHRCGAAATFGADDSQEHNNFHFTNNIVVDCAQDRVGWDDQNVISILGARNVRITGNTFLYTRNNIAAVDGRSFAGRTVLEIARYIFGTSQPVEDVLIDNNKFLCDPQQTSPDKAVNYVIVANQVGIRTHWGTPTSLTKSGNTMTLTHTGAKFSGQLVGRAISHLFATDAGNIGHFVVESVLNSESLTFTNAAGVANVTPGGTYRIFPDRHQSGASGTSRHRTAQLTVSKNLFDNIGTNTLNFENCAIPVIRGNEHHGTVQYLLTGCNNPEIVGNRLYGTGDDTGNIRVSNCSWLYVADNVAQNVPYYSTSLGARDWRISDAAGNVVDFPLLGSRGRARPTNAQEEAVIAWGGLHVDGDTVIVNNTTLTYKATAPGANQFNTTTTLLAAINAIGGYTADDYAVAWGIGTQHYLIRRTTKTAADSGITVTTNSLNPTALVSLRNVNNQGSAMRGSGSAGTIEDKTVVWSQLAGHTCVVTFTADNDAARTLLASGSPAEGKITCVAKASLVDTDYMTIGDGITSPKLYEFDTVGDGVTAGRVQVNVSTDTTAAEVAARLRTAILANQPALSITDNADGTLTVSHLIRGVVGNVTMTENVANAGFTVTGLSNGGHGGYRHLRNVNDSGACAVIQHAKSSNQTGTDLGAEFRWAVNQ